MDITLVLVRHSKSCANHVRHVAGTEERSDPLVAASQHLRDPALSSVGEHMAAEYSPVLKKKLIAKISTGDPDLACYGSSGLRRAKQTARILFGVNPTVFPLFGEKGAIPENTPEGMTYAVPSWPATLRQIHDLSLEGRRIFILVGHGSFLRSIVWPAISGGRPFKGRVHNLDAFFVRGRVTAAGSFAPLEPATYIPYTGQLKPTAADTCALPAKITSNSRMTRYNKRSWRQKRSRRQRGGGVGIPLAYFRDGAQMQGTYPEATGAGIGGSTAAWAREPIQQTGGGCGLPKQQQGGFTPSIMGAFAQNGLRLLPIAGYMGYKMWTNGSKTHRARSRRHRAHPHRGTRRR